MAEPTLYDHRGQPIQRQVLKRELAAANITLRNIWRGSSADDLTPERLAQILRAVANGEMNQYLVLAEEMEEREWHYRSVISTRKLAISGLALSVESPTDDADDLRITDAVRELVMQPDFGAVIFDLLDGLGKGFSVVEVMWDHSGTQWQPSGYEWRDQRFFVWDRIAGRELRLLTDQAPSEGETLAPYKFLVHVPKLKSGLPALGGLARPVSVAYMCKGFGIKDWLAFLEVYGMPLRIGRYGPGANDDDIATLVRAVANLATDAAAVIPQSMNIDLQSAPSVAGVDGFEKLADYLDRQVSKVVLGQTMTTDDGASLSQAKIHNDVRGDILQADKVQIEHTLLRDLVRPYVDLNWGSRKAYPRIVLTVAKPEDLASFSASIAPLVDRGLPVEVSQVLDKFGLEAPAKGAVLLSPMAQPTAFNFARSKVAMNRQRTRADDELATLTDTALQDWQAQMEPLLAPLQELADNARSPEEFTQALPGLLANLDASEMVKTLALTLFRARGIGDATDT